MAKNESMNPPATSAPPPKAVILHIIGNVLLARARSIVAELGLADLVRHTPQSAGELTAATGAQADARRYAPAEAIMVIGKIAVEFPVR